jgi:hypothetical protein
VPLDLEGGSRISPKQLGELLHLIQRIRAKLSFIVVEERSPRHGNGNTTGRQRPVRDNASSSERLPGMPSQASLPSPPREGGNLITG